MAIAFDNASSAVGVNVSSIQWTHTATGTNGFIVMGFAGLTDVSACAFNGVNLTLQTAVNLSASPFSARGHIFSLAGPNAGAFTASAVLFGSEGTDQFGGGAVTYVNVSQAAPVVSKISATAASASVHNLSISTQAAQVVLGLCGTGNGGSAPLASWTNPVSQNQRFFISTGNVQAICSDIVAGGAATSLSWSTSLATATWTTAISFSGTAIAVGVARAFSLCLTGVGR